MYSFDGPTPSLVFAHDTGMDLKWEITLLYNNNDDDDDDDG